ncbi:hypothetical protein [Leptospirillum ferriphilum]|uniref:hypothetical protein n=1 Tax=Leptospirillum ferriphilum TaxID=178606 RepID=UPI000985A58A|nr:hypothetical protein [Leptospirillum ferriphilum]OOH80795.1 hypothetical protein BOX30_05505 [Leptospirillum ferriphilum]
MKQLNTIHRNGVFPVSAEILYWESEGNPHALRGLFALEVVNNSFYEADTFEVRAALSAQKPPHQKSSWWLSQPEIMVNVTLTQGPLSRLLILGRVDDVVVDPVSDEIVLSGRDLTGLLIDSRTSGQAMQQYQNATASQIVTGLMSPFSPWFKANAITGTSQQVGSYFAGNFLYLFRNRSYWDIITWLAQTNVSAKGTPDPFVAYVSGAQLFFGPAPAPTGYYLLEWQTPAKGGYPHSNIEHITLAHNLTLAKDIAVTVMGYNPMVGRYQATASGKHNQGHTGGGSFSQSLYSSVGYQHFVYIANGLTKLQAQQMAQSKTKELSRHEYILRATQPGDLTLDPMQLVRLQGDLLPSYEMDFWVNAVTWRLSTHPQRFEMELWCKNHPTGSQVVL